MSKEETAFFIKGTYEMELKDMLHQVNISQVRDNPEVFFDMTYNWLTMLLPDLYEEVKPTYEEISKEIAEWFHYAKSKHLNELSYRGEIDRLYKRNGVKLKMKIVAVIHKNNLWLRLDRIGKLLGTSGGAVSKTLKHEQKTPELLSSEIE